MPSTGTRNLLCLLIDFSDFPHLVSEQDIDTALFGEGQPEDLYRGLHKFYSDSSNGLLNITGDVYGWYRAPHPRSYYCNDVNPIDNETAYMIRKELIEFALDEAFIDGANFTDYDIDGDGEIEEFIVIWSGWQGNWVSFWWAIHPSPWGTWRAESAGFFFAAYSWLDEVEWSYLDPPPANPMFESWSVIHETGHSLGLPDYYDYDGSIGPDGGVGYLDVMDYYGDHNAFSKYILGWIIPQIITTDNLYKYNLGRTVDTSDAVVLKPSYSSNPYSEYFVIEHRRAAGYDEFPTYYGDGLMIWHANASQTAGVFDYDNAYTDLKLLRLVQADGLEEIESSDYSSGDPGDFWTAGMMFGPDTIPNSYFYDGETYGGFCWVNADNVSTINLDCVCHNNLTGIVVNPQGIPMAGISIAMSGVSSDEQTTGVDGAFAWIGAMGGTYTITPGLADFAFTPPSSSFTISDGNVDLLFVGERIDMPKFTGFSGLNDGGVFGAVVGVALAELNVAVLNPENIEQLTYTLDISPLGTGPEDPDPVSSSSPGGGFPAAFDLSHLAGRNYKLQLSGVGTNSGSPDSVSKAVALYLFNALGDTNADGEIDGLDLQFLYAHLGELEGTDGFEPFCDSDLSGTITEADASAIGYYWTGQYAPTHSASGYVESALGDPLVGVTMSFTGSVVPVLTNSRGYWSQIGIPDGTYTVSASLSGWDFLPADRSFTIAGGNETVPDFIGTEQIVYYTASGHVEDSGGGALQGVTMSFTGGLASVTTDSDGDWARDGILDGVFTVTPSLSGWTFSPPEASFTVSGDNETVPDFIGTEEPVYDETEDNDDLGQADLISDVSFTGWTGNIGPGGYDGDTEDLTTFTISSGFDIEIDLLIANGSTDLDVELLNSSGDFIAGSYGTTQQEEVTEANLPSGTYYIRIFRWSGNDGTSDYTLDVAYAAGTSDMAYGYVVDSLDWGIEGVTMSFTGGLTSVTTNSIGYWARDGIPDGTYTVTPSLSSWTFDPTDRTFTVSGGNEAVPDFIGTYEAIYDETENNDNLGQADLIPSTSFVGWTGNIGPGGYDGDTEDITTFTKSSSFNIEIDLWIANGITDLDLELLDWAGGFIAGSYNVTQHEEITVTGLPSGTYYISVYRYFASSGTSDYALDVDYY